MNRNKGNAYTKTNGNGGQRIFEEEGKRTAIKNNSNDDEGSQESKLLDSHVTNQAEAVATDVLWQRVLLYCHF